MRRQHEGCGFGCGFERDLEGRSEEKLECISVYSLCGSFGGVEAMVPWVGSVEGRCSWKGIGHGILCS